MVGRRDKYQGGNALVKHNLPEWARRSLGTLVEVLTPRSKDFHPDLKEYIVDYVDRYVLLLEIGPLIFMGKRGGFAKLNSEDRERYINGWINSKLQVRRELIRGVKGLVMLSFYSHPVVMEHIGYDIQGHVCQRIGKEIQK
jgi:hypothetical protein